MDMYKGINELKKINFCHDHSTFLHIIHIWENKFNKKEICNYNDNQWSEDESKVSHIQMIFTMEVKAD
jgi:hypothetical protein